jgi:hypothetical protein
MRGATRRANKELKLTKPSQNGASQLNSVLGVPFRGGRVTGYDSAHPGFQGSVEYVHGRSGS